MDAGTHKEVLAKLDYPAPRCPHCRQIQLPKGIQNFLFRTLSSQQKAVWSAKTQLSEEEKAFIQEYLDKD
ncbi:hypothetical protein SORDD16_01693 [Streptococcus oralis]|uniref:Uncharacterized protein n=1 Tax=Streptococcus oralis TaxID=1303 RepID=A0A139P9W7_STROR|nr:hypothetical protein SORDD16_01693 [Streptococcus oralis]